MAQSTAYFLLDGFMYGSYLLPTASYRDLIYCQCDQHFLRDQTFDWDEYSGSDLHFNLDVTVNKIIKQNKYLHIQKLIISEKISKSGLNS